MSQRRSSRQEETLLSSFSCRQLAATLPTSWSDDMISQQRQYNIKELLAAHGKLS